MKDDRMSPLYRKNIYLICGLFLLYRLSAQSVGGTTSGAASYCSTTNSGFISVTGYTGTIQYWELSTNGGTSWTSIGNVTPNQSYFNLTQTTCYRAIVQNGVFPPDTSTISCVTIYPPTVAGALSPGGSFCGTTGAGTITLSGNTGNVLNWQYSTNGGTTWTSITNTTTVLTYTGVTQSTIFEAVVQNSSFCAIDTTGQSVFVVDPVSIAGTLNVTSGNDSVCFGINNGMLTISGNTGQVLGWASSVDGGLSWTAITNTTVTQSYVNLTQSMIFQAYVQSGLCPPDTSPKVNITVLPLPTVNAGPDSTIYPGWTVTLNGSGNGTPLWLPSGSLSNQFIFNPAATPSVTTAYILVITDTNACSNADTVVITVDIPVFNGTVSNYFTPNGDGLNDTWYVQNIQNFTGNEVFVYNIYGNEVYNVKDYKNDWKGTYNGNDLPDGTYYYVLKFDNQPKIFKGSLDIIRKK